jgi:hypothetical protein
LRVAATVLIDGFVAGTWTTAVTRKTATLTIVPLAPLSAALRRALEDEGERLLRFAEPAATSFEVRL